MAEAKQGRKVVIPVDGSKNSERAFECEYQDIIEKFRLHYFSFPNFQSPLKLSLDAQIFRALEGLGSSKRLKKYISCIKNY